MLAKAIEIQEENSGQLRTFERYKIIQAYNNLKRERNLLQDSELKNYPQDGDKVNGAGRLVRHPIFLFLQRIFLKILT